MSMSRSAWLLLAGLMALPAPALAAIGRTPEGSDFLGPVLYFFGLALVAVQALIPLTLGIFLAKGAGEILGRCRRTDLSERKLQ